MRLLIVANNANIVVCRFRKELIEAMLLRGDAVVIAVPEGVGCDGLRALGCELISVQMDRRKANPLSDLSYYKQLKSIVRSVNPDVVLTYTIKPNVYGGLAVKGIGVPYIATVTGLGDGFEGMFKSLVTFMYRRAMRKCSNIFFQNEANKKEFIDLRIIDEERCVLVPGSGVNLAQYSYSNMPEGPVRFLFASRIMKKKGIDEYFMAARRLKAEYPDSEFGVIGWLEEECGSVIETLQRDGIICYYGFRQDAADFMRRAHCIVLPSYNEGMANVLLEGAALGRALIASDITGCRETIINGVSGYVCQPKNAESLYDCMKRFISLSEADRRAMGQAGRERVEAHFDRRIVTDAMLAAVDRVCKRGSAIGVQNG